MGRKATIYVTVMLLFICLLLLIRVVSQRRELDFMYRQLLQKERGSRGELSALTRQKSFLRLYRKLNQIFASAREGEVEYLRSQKQLKQTISSLAHDIRTPLTSAAGYLQMLQEITEDEKQLRYEGIMDKRLMELKDMLEELFLYTKLTSEEFVLECKNTAVFAVFSDSMIGMYHLFEEKQIEPVVRFEQEDYYVSANPEALGRIFRNLIQNALLHGEGGLTVEQRGNTMRFLNPVGHTTEDGEQQEGGILPDVSRIFERFYKADQARRKGSSGLGLAIVKELMLRMGGTVEAGMEGELLVITLTFQPAF